MNEERERIGMKNYIKLGKSYLSSWDHYVFLDTDDILAESLMNRHMVRREIEGILGRDNEEYRMISVKVWKKDELRFLQSMEELKGKMLLFGHLDYQSRGGDLVEEVRNELRKDVETTGRIPLPMGGTVRAALSEL